MYTIAKFCATNWIQKSFAGSLQTSERAILRGCTDISTETTALVPPCVWYTKQKRFLQKAQHTDKQTSKKNSYKKSFTICSTRGWGFLCHD